jgi:hypothetical protein
MAHIGMVAAHEAPHEMTAVSASLWELFTPDSTPVAKVSVIELLTFPHGACQLRDFNQTRAVDAQRQMDQAKQHYLDDDYPQSQQAYLASIGTLPAYQGHDIAGHVLRQGLRTIMEDPQSPTPLFATLLATPAGEPLYFENGYRSIENVTIYALDKEQSFVFDVMVKQLRV